MLHLIKNEWTKLWAKKATWIMLIISAIAVILLLVGTKWISSEFEESDWKVTEQTTISDAQAALDAGNLSKAEIKSYEEDIQLSQYRLDENIAPITSESASNFISSSSSLLMFTSLFSIIVAASIVSFEFGTGTIKMLLTRPIARWKILLSKLLTSYIFAISLGVFTLLFSSLLGLIFFSSTGIDLKIIDGNIVEINSYKEIFITYALEYGDITMSILFAFMLGTLFNSSSLAIGLTLFIGFTSTTISMLLIKYEFIKYIWFNVTNLNGIRNDSSLIPDLTMPFALSIMTIYAVLFIALSFITFTRKDIKA